MFKKTLAATCLLSLLIPQTVWAASFYVDSGYDAQGRSQIEAKRKYISEKAIFFVEEESWESSWQDDLRNLADEFDSTIYPKMRQFYGQEWKPGIDNNKRVAILITPMKDKAGGYFRSIDGYQKKQVGDDAGTNATNERDIVYLNSKNIESSFIKSYLAHEFQHLINFYQKDKLRGVSEETWLNEMLSEYAPTLCGYNEKNFETSYLANRLDKFLQNPSNSLTGWRNKPFDYGPINLFIHYLVDQEGKEVLSEIEQTSKTGLQAVPKISQHFLDWTVANYLNKCQEESSRFCYSNPNLDFQVAPTAAYNLNPVTTLSVGVQVEDWAPHWYKISGISNGHQTLEVNFTGKEDQDGSGNAKSNFQISIISITKNNNAQIDFLSLDNESQQGTLSVPNFGNEINSVVVIPVNQDMSPDNKQTTLSFVAKTTHWPAPQIDSLSSYQANLSPNEKITIKGDDFYDGLEVKFGQKNASDIEFVDKQAVKVLAPSVEKSQTVKVQVINPDGQKATAEKLFEYSNEKEEEEDKNEKLKKLIVLLRAKLAEVEANKQNMLKEGQLLVFGSRGEEVEKLQTILNKEGLYSYKIDGVFGPLTRQAVVKFQIEHDLKVDGIVGPNTRKALNTTL